LEESLGPTTEFGREFRKEFGAKRKFEREFGKEFGAKKIMCERGWDRVWAPKKRDLFGRVWARVWAQKPNLGKSLGPKAEFGRELGRELWPQNRMC
jgi:hypothetical protein